MTKSSLWILRGLAVEAPIALHQAQINPRLPPAEGTRLVLLPEPLHLSTCGLQIPQEMAAYLDRQHRTKASHDFCKPLNRYRVVLFCRRELLKRLRGLLASFRRATSSLLLAIFPWDRVEFSERGRKWLPLAAKLPFLFRRP